MFLPCNFACIYLPFKLEDVEFVLQNSECLQFTLDNYPGQLSTHPPTHKILNLNFKLMPKIYGSKEPLRALTIFTDGSGASHKSVVTWRNPQTSEWESDVEVIEGSPQIAELAAVVRAFKRFSEQSISVVTDSAYVAGVVERAEHSMLKEVSNPKLYSLLSQLVFLLSHQKQPYFIMHVRSHTDLPGPIVEGNQRADALAAPVQVTAVPGIFQQAELSHQLYHQSILALVRMFHLMRNQARAIVATCPSCQRHQLPSLGSGVCPRGLHNNQLWK